MIREAGKTNSWTAWGVAWSAKQEFIKIRLLEYGMMCEAAICKACLAANKTMEPMQCLHQEASTDLTRVQF
jgi:hypothetical protein